jgi:hypothetical protein
MKIRIAFLICVAAFAMARAKAQEAEIEPVLINDLTPEFIAAQDQRREYDRAEDLSVLATIVREDLARLYGRDPHAALDAGHAWSGAAEFVPGDPNVPFDAAVLELFLGTRLSGREIDVPLAQYLPGYGVIVQVAAPPPRVPASSPASVPPKKETLSRWEATRRRLRGAVSPESAYDMASCTACHTADTRSAMTLLWKKYLVEDEHVWRHPSAYKGVQGGRPTVEQLTTGLIRVLADSGSHLRHLQPDERITLSVQFDTQPPGQAADRPDTQNAPGSGPRPETSSQAPTHSRELAGDLLLRQSKYAEAEKAYAEAFEAQLEVQPQQPRDDLLGKAYAAAVFHHLSQAGEDFTSDEQFLRRIYLDLAGVLPDPAKVEQFVGDRSPDKRTKLIDELLRNSDFVAQWANKWKEARRQSEGGHDQAQGPAAAPTVEQVRNAVDEQVLRRLHERAPAPRALPLPGRISVTATKRQLDAMAAGALKLSEFEKQAVVQVFNPSEE